MKFKRTQQRVDGVWIVIDESVDAPQPVLGVFATQEEARVFVDAHVPGEFEDLAYGHYYVGWSFDGGRRYRR